MAFTGHGHFVPGSSREGIQPDRVYKCGGPGVCAACTADAWHVTGVPVHGDIYPVYVMRDGEEQLIGIAHLSGKGIFITEDEPSQKEDNANQEGSSSEDRGNQRDRTAYDVRSRQLGFGR